MLNPIIGALVADCSLLFTFHQLSHGGHFSHLAAKLRVVKSVADDAAGFQLLFVNEARAISCELAVAVGITPFDFISVYGDILGTLL